MNREMERRAQLRRDKIAERERMAPELRLKRSEQIARRIASSRLFQDASVIMSYRAVRGEVDLALLERLADGRRLAYPRCVSRTELAVYAPWDKDAWEAGRYGILEPIPERSDWIAPEQLDLVICPCSAFDAMRRRLGMGGGYYDRFLPRCVSAHIIAAAFEAQRADRIPAEPWDVAMERIVTERAMF